MTSPIKNNMVQANELRLGNIVQVDGQPMIIHGINRHGEIKLNMYADTWQIDDLSPIPLSPDVLEKAGFVRHQNGLYVNNDVWLELNAAGWFTPVYCDGTSFRGYIAKHISHLHQLQNLFYSLTGEELTINL